MTRTPGFGAECIPRGVFLGVTLIICVFIFFLQTTDLKYSSEVHSLAALIVFAQYGRTIRVLNGCFTCKKNSSSALVILCDGFCVLLHQVPKGGYDDCYGTEDEPLLCTCSSYCKPCQHVERI